MPRSIEPFLEFTEPPPSIEEDPSYGPSRKDEMTPLQIQNTPPIIPKPPKPPLIDVEEEKPLQTKIPSPSLTPLNELEDGKDVDIPQKIAPTPPIMQSQPTGPPLPSDLNLQIFAYIKEHGGEDGIPHNTIVAYFEGRASRVDIEEVLEDGINEGKFYKPKAQKYQIL